MTILIGLVAESVDGPDTNVVGGVGVALLVAGIACLWAFVHLRGKTHDRLRVSIDIAYEGLTEQAFMSLQSLHSHLSEMLPDSDMKFDPLDMIVDPVTVERPARHSIRILRERHRIHRRFRALLGICSSLKYCAGIFVLFVLISILLYQFNFSNAGMWQASFWLTAASGCGVLILFIAYSALVARIDASIEHASPLPPGNGESTR